MLPHAVGKNTLLGWSGRTPHNAFFFRFGCQCEPRQPVSHQIDPQNVDRQQWDRQPHEWGKKNGPYFTRVTGHGVFYELADVIKDTPPFTYRMNNGGKIVVQQYECR